MSSGKPNSYSRILSAVLAAVFNLSAIGQSTAPVNQESALELQRRSVSLQRQSVERQRTAAGAQVGEQPPRPFPLAPAPQGPDCGAVAPLILERIVDRASKAYSVSINLIHAVIRQESGGNPCAISEKGAMGLMQLMPDTAVEMGATQPFDIQQNVTAGTRLLAALMQRYNGDLNRVLGAYNAGTAAVDRAGGPPPFPETTNYIRSILQQIKSPLDPKLFPPVIR